MYDIQSNSRKRIWKCFLLNPQLAEIVSDSHGQGYFSGKLADVTKYPDYVNNPDIDGDNTYGSAYASFPRRAQVGGVWSNFNTGPDLNGSRSIAAHLSTVFKNHSYNIHMTHIGE